MHLTRPLNFLGCVSPTLPPKGQPLTRAKKEEPGRPDRAGRENSNCTVILNDPLGKNSEVAAPSSSCFAWEVWYSSVVLALQLSSYLAAWLEAFFSRLCCPLDDPLALLLQLFLVICGRSDRPAGAAAFSIHDIWENRKLRFRAR